ncbi:MULTISPECIES: flagellar biosynthetic protein FliO [Xanthomonas translucens group]|uniref:flagellar biosynthetic protein FliO n=1 Tax=Xanthomonas translucens group TaxID=3390202 RepID=UPI0002A7A5BC|nr:flagellar biosynthetic protein FliO [Xanthomonas translucens]AKK67867.1 flagellar protein [Xanthomonas translucens pv. undulosa]AVY66824.1 flagellar protein [Xanthomonas translucens pv. undulosa]ELQ07657.1 flagellar biogenesis protein flio [Xanthomonas translucens DAR61454]MBC3973077.1 flagellar biosynthetic protein FliO [Xanthomonas translucens pv. undulosa]MCT8272223.1 flagellar biosynthetic protein FliO [Xanthomonas translucens pv. undulosa]
MSLLLAAATQAAKSASGVGSAAPSPPSLIGAVFALLLVLGLILGMAWVLKRLPGSGFRPAEGLRVVASLAVGAKERVVVIDVNGEQLLLGVSPGGVRTLHHLPEPLPQAPAPSLPNLRQLKHFPDFAQLLAQKLRKDK